MIKVPKTHTSTVFDLTHGHNDVHEPNDESILSVAANLNRELRFSNNPHFNKKELKTQHARYITTLALFKMGQIDEGDLEIIFKKIEEDEEAERQKKIEK